MTYTQLIECLFRFSDCKGLSTNTRMCLLSLFHCWKGKGCPESFKMPLRALSKLTNSSAPTTMTSVKELEESGIIKVKRGGPRVPNTYKVMLKVMVNVLNISGVMLNLFIKETLHSSTNTRSNNTNTNTNTNNRPNSVKPIDNHRKTLKQPLTPQKPKKLSMWVLKNQKEACEAELKKLRDNGCEVATGHRWANEPDRLRARVLKKKIVAIVMQMQEAES